MYKLLAETNVVEDWESPCFIDSMCPTTDGQVWTSTAISKTLTLLDRNGQVLQEVKHNEYIIDISLSPTTRKLWVCDYENNIMELASGRLTNTFRTRERPLCICVTTTNHVILGMVKQISKFTTQGHMVLTTMDAETGKPSIYSPFRVSECAVTRNVAVNDWNSKTNGGDGYQCVVVMDTELKELFVYRGDIPSTYRQTRGDPFNPYGVVYDSVGNLVIGDYVNNSILLLSGGGEFLRIIHTDYGIACAIGVDNEDVLWAGFRLGIDNVRLLQYVEPVTK